MKNAIQAISFLKNLKEKLSENINDLKLFLLSNTFHKYWVHNEELRNKIYEQFDKHKFWIHVFKNATIL